MSEQPDNVFRQIDTLCDRFEAEWKAGRSPRLESLVASAAEAIRPELFRELLRLERDYRQARDVPLTAGEAEERFAGLGEWVAAILAETALPEAREVVTGAYREPARPGPFHAGREVANRYRIVARIGAGGMGEVYRAEDLTLGQTVALKFLPEGRVNDPDWIAQLQKEVQLARQVSHPNVCRVHDVGEDVGRWFLSMEYIDGEDLAASVERVGRLPPERVVACAAQLCDGLTALHEQGMLHRDLKPSNILLDRRRKVRLVDFGLAALAGQIDEKERHAGTLAYMAPEQLTGRDLSVRTDLFALGLVLYELTTGKRPFPGRSVEELKQQHVSLAPVPPSRLVAGVDPALDRVILRCLQVNEARRPASANEVKQALPPLSPRETQEVEGSGQLRPAVALALLAGTLLLLTLHAWLSPRIALWQQVPLKKSPEKLAELARTHLEKLGYQESDHRAFGLAWDLDHIHAVRSRSGADRWGNLEKSRSPVLYFWYRESPEPLHPFYRRSPADPPPLVPGMVCIILDTSGRLVEFRAVHEGNPGVKGTDWENALFAEAGLDRTVFEEVTLRRLPPVYGDERRAWTGEEGGEPVRVEAAAYQGQPVYFLARAAEREGEKALPDRIASPWHARLIDTMTGPGAVILGVVVLGGAILARRNWMLGRADGQGAMRLGILYLATTMGGWLLITAFWAMPTQRSMFVVFLGIATFWLVVLMVAYLALEPFLRRRWPERLSAWNRLMAGRFRDPLVGRHILLGVMVGLALEGLFKVLPLVDTWRGQPSWYLEWVTGLPIRGPEVNPVGWTLSTFTSALGLTFLVAVCFLLLVQFFRREWLAVGILIAVSLPLHVWGLLGVTESSPLMWGGAALVLLGVYLMLVRVGILGLLATYFTAMLAATMPLTTEPPGWLTTNNWLTILLIAGVAGYGAVVSMGGQSLFRDEV